MVEVDFDIATTVDVLKEADGEITYSPMATYTPQSNLSD
jgi:hypothetical protein